MSRTTPSDVEEIFHGDADIGSDTEFLPFIEIATEFVDDIDAADGTLSASRLEKIERLLAAHLACLEYPRLAEKAIGPLSEVRSGETGMHFDATQYGQQAVLLDPTGVLADAGTQSVSFDVADGIQTD